MKTYMLVKHGRDVMKEVNHRTPDVRIDLFNWDCLRGLDSLLRGENSFEVVMTSPPYNIGIDYEGYDDARTEEEYREWLERVCRAVSGVLGRFGSLFLNLAGPPSDPLKPFRVLDQCALPHFQCQNVIHWVKSADWDGMGVQGHCKPVNSQRFLTCGHEYVFHLTHRRDVPLDKLAIGVPYRDETNLTRGTRGKNGNRRDRGNVWPVAYETIQRRATDRPHPATFPVALAERCLTLHGLEKINMVLDPFMGLGTTAIAAARLGKHCLGFEVCEDYWLESGNRVEVELRRLFAEQDAS